MDTINHFKDGKQFELFFNFHPDALLIVKESDSRLVEVNQGFCKLFGYEKNEVVGKTFSEIEVWMHHDEREKLFEQLIENKSEDNFEAVFVRKNGTWFCGSLTASLIEFENEPHIICNIHNISTKKALITKLEESEWLLNETQKIAGLGTYTFDIENNKWSSSKLLDEIFGIDDSFERTFENWVKIIHPEWQETMNSYFNNEVIGKKKRFDKEYKIVQINSGEERWVDGKGKLEYNKNGEPIKMLGTIMDITYRKNIELKLNHERLLKDNILETNPVAIVVVEKDGAISYSNKTGERVLGLSKQDIQQRTYNAPGWKITDWDGNPFPEEKLPFLIVKNTLKPCFNVQHAIEYSNGKRTMLSINAAPRFDDKKNFNGMVASLEDITEQTISKVKIQEQNVKLRELNATKDKFFSIVAHDLKGPTGSLKKLSHLLIEKFHKFNQQDIYKMVSAIENAASETYKLLENLLDWSRVQRKIAKAEFEECKISDLVDEMLHLYNELASDKAITLKNNIEDNQTVKCDVNMTKTILRNLISNAIKFTNENGKVFIKSRKVDEQIEIRVVDSGVGIESENQSKLFDIANNNIKFGTKNEKGTGIGLPLCKDLIELQGGKIGVESKVGVGSEFFFILPIT